jgi:hypothetical protein
MAKKVSFINAFLLLFVGILTSLGPGQTLNLGSTPVSSNRFLFLLSEGPIPAKRRI